MKRGIYLIGFSGTGKSTVARLVARARGLSAHDLDEVIAARAGLDIPGIFARDGEEGFRELETQALAAVSAGGDFVVATGGGAPLREANRALMAETGWVVCLEGRPETLVARIQAQLHRGAADAVRPLLGGASPLERLRAMKEKRQPLYACADWTVHTDRLTAEQVAAEVSHGVDLLEACSPAP